MPRTSRHSRDIDARIARFRLRIRDSRIHRFGVFAADVIPARRCVIEYTGRLLRMPDAERELCKPGRPRRALMARLGRGWIIDAIRGGSGAEYVNHSCDPNLFVRKTRWHIFLMSRRRIEQGEELTMDYKLRPRRPRFACTCGSEKCRGFMNLS